MGKKRIITDQSVGAAAPATSGVGAAKKTKAKRQVFRGAINISSSFNNTIVSAAGSNGEIFAWSSAGALGFKGAKKSTPYAATMVGRDAAEKAKRFGMQEAKISVKGIGPGREGAIRGVIGSGINITAITDDTPIPHNGVKPAKPRRV